jgi:hypothetical protein
MTDQRPGSSSVRFATWRIGGRSNWEPVSAETRGDNQPAAVRELPEEAVPGAARGAERQRSSPQRLIGWIEVEFKAAAADIRPEVVVRLADLWV